MELETVSDAPVTSVPIRSWLPPLLIGAGAAAVLASAAGLASVAGWLPLEWPWSAKSARSTQGVRSHAMVLPAAFKPAAASACGTCGTVEAVRAVRMKPPGSDPSAPAPVSYRITIRMDDGSYRTLAQPSPPTLGVGDAVQIAEGVATARR